MRIIAGNFRGRRLASPRDLSVRPMTDRVKQAVFDMLSTRFPFEGCEALDLFSGSGSLGLEALSRGARHVTFVESSRSSLELLRHNIRELRLDEQCTVHQADAVWFAQHVRSSFDLVLADPPYRLPQIADLPLLLAGAVRPGGFAVMEHRAKTVVSALPGGFAVLRRAFGQTVVLIMQAPAPPHAHTEQGKTLP